jgi:hypothetical protein
MTHESIDTIRTYITNQHSSRFAPRKYCTFRSRTYALFEIRYISSSILSLYQYCKTSRDSKCYSRIQESVYRQIDNRSYRTNSSESASKWEEYQRYSCRSATILYIKEVLVCLSAISLNMMWCLNINLTGFMSVNLPKPMSY